MIILQASPKPVVFRVIRAREVMSEKKGRWNIQRPLGRVDREIACGTPALPSLA
jgi:hypothetical protein